MPFGVKPHILILPVAAAQGVGLTLLLAEFVMVGQQIATVAVTTPDAGLKQPLVDLAYR